MWYAWNMDYPMEYVFYGIAFVAIWTIINVFIETTSEEKSRPSKKFVHSKTYSDFRGSKWMKNHEGPTARNNDGRITRTHEGPITVSNFDWEAAESAPRVSPVVDESDEDRKDTGTKKDKLDLTIGGSDVDSKEEEEEAADDTLGKRDGVVTKETDGSADALESMDSHVESKGEDTDTLRKEEMPKEIDSPFAALETAGAKCIVTYSLKDEICVSKEIGATSALIESVEMKEKAVDSLKNEVLSIDESSSVLLESTASNIEEDDEGSEELPPPPPLPPPLEEEPEVVEPSSSGNVDEEHSFFTYESPHTCESEPSGGKDKFSSNDVEVLCVTAKVTPSGASGGRLSGGAEREDVLGVEEEVKTNGIIEVERLSEDEVLDVENVEEGWKPRLTTCVPFGPPIDQEVRGGDPNGIKPEWIACAPFGPPIIQSGEEDLEGIDITGIRNEEPVDGSSKGGCDAEIGGFFQPNQFDLRRDDKERSSYRRSCCADDPLKGNSIGKYFGSLQNLAPKESRRASIYSTEERNLLKNNCGQHDFAFWDMKYDPCGWIVDKNPTGKEVPPSVNHFGLPLPEFDGQTSAFETVNMMCRKEQTVDLIEEGFNVNFLDEVQPPIEVSEWITIVPECRSTYELRVKLLDREKKTITEYPLDHTFSSIKDTEWIKVSYTFKEYGPGLRYILFSHGAVKWHGNRGCKMTGSAVRVLTP